MTESMNKKVSDHNKKGQKPTVFAFIDASNIIYGSARHGWKMDFEKLMTYLRNRFLVQRVFYYAGLDKSNKKQIAFYKKIEQFGYEMRLVPVKRFKDGSKKADVDSRLTFEAMRDIDNYSSAVFMTGDGDYYWLFAHLLAKKKWGIRLIAHSKSTARELKQLFGGHFTDLSRLRNELERKTNKKAVDAKLGSTARIMR